MPQPQALSLTDTLVIRDALVDRIQNLVTAFNSWDDEDQRMYGEFVVADLWRCWFLRERL